MPEDSSESLTLRVAKAIPSDVGHGRARVPFDNELNLKPGDIVEIAGEQSHAGDEDAVTGDHWSLVEAASGEALDARPEADLLLLRHHRAEHQALARLGLDLGDGDAVTEAHACVFSDYSVDSDNSQVRILGSAAPDDGGGALFARDLDYVAWLEIEFIVERNACATVSYVAWDGLRHPESQ